MKLPLYIQDFRTKIIIITIGVIATLLFYQTTNRIHLFEPQLLPMLWVDNITPFWPWTVWIYFSEYFIFICAFFQLRDDGGRMKFFYSYMGILIFSSFFFVFYPVTFPRFDYPVNLEQAGASGLALNFLRNYLDTPANCLPSLHVSTCYISAFCFWGESKRKFWFYFVWSTLVAISTMTTKQHYFVDIISALAVTYLFYWLCFVKVSYKEIRA